MHATVPRNEGVAGNWTDGLSRETGEAVVRDLLEFEGFRSHDRWIRQPPDGQSAEGHQRQGVRARERRSVASADRRASPGEPMPVLGNSTDVTRSSRLAAAWLRGSGRGECR